MLIAALLMIQAAPPAIQTCLDGSVIRATDQCMIMPDHRLPVFKLFFDSGSSEIRREWEEEIDKAVARFPGAGTRYRVDAYSDTPGSAAANRRIAALRAKVVAAGLRQRGVGDDRISVLIHGEDRLLVPTAQGVREIQNRRVEIMAFP